MVSVLFYPLRQLFDNDNMKDKESNKMLQAIGGYKGLEERLNTNRQVPFFVTQVGISATGQDKNDRIKKYGRNDPVVKPPKTLWDMIL